MNPDCPACGDILRIHDLYGPVYRVHGGQVDGVVLICDTCNDAGRACFWHTKRADDHKTLHKGQPD